MANWLERVCQRYRYPESGHDYDVSWDYEVDEGIGDRERADLVRFHEMLEMDLFPKLGLFRSAKFEFVRDLGGDVAKYVNGTVSAPVVVIDLGAIQRHCVNMGECDREIRLSILHELGHAVQEAYGVEMDEAWAEAFARNYLFGGEVMVPEN
jgi:hypothetical protein